MTIITIASLLGLGIILGYGIAVRTYKKGINKLSEDERKKFLDGLSNF